MLTLDSIFDALKGAAEVAKIIKVTTEYSAMLKRRRSIPVRYWPALIDALQAVGIDATEADFVRIYNDKRSKDRVSSGSDDTPPASDARKAS